MTVWFRPEDTLPKKNGEYIVCQKMSDKVTIVCSTYFIDGIFTATAGEVVYWTFLPELPDELKARK